MRSLTHIVTTASLSLVGLAASIGASAQDWRTLSGDFQRTGLPSLAPSTPGGTNPNVYNNPGRAFLRWWDPVRATRNPVDNDSPATSLTGTWLAPTGGLFGRLAFNSFDTVGQPNYRWSDVVAATSRTDPTAGATSTYTWTINGLTPGAQYQVSLNIPLGPTDVDAGAGTDVRFPQQFYVVRVTGGATPFVDVLDTFSFGGTFVPIGNGGAASSQVFVPTGTSLTVTLFNTAPLAADGSLRQRNFDPTTAVVYADATQAIGNVTSVAGAYASSPVAMELTQTPPIGGAVQFPRRVFAARNETTFIGSFNRAYNMTTVTSFTYNGQDVFDPTNTGRRNMVWSWPVRRPFDNSTDEAQRYVREKRDWLTGPVPANPAINRANQRIQMDNLSAGASFSGTYVVTPGTATTLGPDLLVSAVSLGGATAQAVYNSSLPDGNYVVEAYIPSGAFGGLPARGAEYQIFAGAALIDTVNIDQSGTGWVRVTSPPFSTYPNTAAAPLRVVVTNRSNNSGDAGRVVVADGIRFVRPAELTSNSTPVAASTLMTLPGGATAQRDVLVAPLENGHIYVLDAHGDPATGGPPATYWAYPSENPAADPNNDPAQDGQGNIATAPTGFDISSAAVGTVNGRDVLFIGSRNGRVYALDMRGRGDGTTERIWTYPNDYNPASPNSPMGVTTLGQISSVTLGISGGRPTVFVGTAEGRVYALDAEGDAATKSTTVAWQFPAAAATPLGPVRMAPVIDFGGLFFGAPTAQGSTAGAIFRLDPDTGAQVWRQDTPGGLALSTLNTASPVAVPAAQNVGGGAFAGLDMLVWADQGGRVFGVDPANGNFRWGTNENFSGAAGPLAFTHLTVFDNSQNLQQRVPVVIVPANSGRLRGMLLDGSANRAGGRSVWEYALDGGSQRASVALGGWNTTDIHSWMYTGDSTGFFYAFNSINDFNPLPITPGIPPGQEVFVPNEPGSDELNDIVRSDRIRLITPEAFDRLNELLQAGTIAESDIVNAATNDVATRRAFEFGESLYVLVFDMPVLTGNLSNYFLEFEISSRGRASQRRQVQVRQYNTAGGLRTFCLANIALLPAGAGSLVPGDNFLTARAVAPGQRGLQSAPVNLPPPTGVPPNPARDFQVGNPLGVITLDNSGNILSSVGNTTDVLAATVLQNGNNGTDQNPTPPPTGPFEPFSAFGPDLTTKFDPLAHGGAGVSQVIVLDRSLLTLVFGPNQGLANVRFNSQDFAWRPDGTPTGGVIKPLTDNTGVNYLGMEDYPVRVPNISQDYPDVNRENFRATSRLFAGSSENPLFENVSLAPPSITAAAASNYRTNSPTNGYDTQMARTLNRTLFDLALDVPRFQPPGLLGYYGSQFVYVESNQPGQDPDGSEPFRSFGLQVNVARDERLAMTTPTVDLGSLPSGGGFNGGAGFGPLAPWFPATTFSPWNGFFNQGPGAMFQNFGVENQGNVNLLNVRVAKFYTDANGARPVELFAPGGNELSWLDASLHLYSNLDPRFAASQFVPGTAAGFDANARVILQKPRPGDIVPTRLNVNPTRRQNANLRVATGPLYDPAIIAPNDPFIGATAPIGTPSAPYTTRIFAFEDDPSNNVGVQPTLGGAEPFSEPSMNLRFTVREARLTNAATLKSAPNLERIVGLNDNFIWSNTQPSGVRDGDGNLFVAFASNRLAAAGPNWVPGARGPAETALQDQWRIYLSALANSTGAIPTGTQSPIGDLNGWVPNSNARWFSQALGPLPNVSPLTLFAVDTTSGETLVPESVRFNWPTFPSNGSFNPGEFPSGAGRSNVSNLFLAYVGSATKLDAAGNPTPISQIMVSTIDLTGPAETDVRAVPWDPTSQKSRPSVVQSGPEGAVFYTAYANGLGQIVWNNFEAAGGFSRTTSLQLSNAFESVGAPSAVLRRYRNLDRFRVELAFTAKLRGRQFQEAFIGRLNANASGQPQGRNPLVAFGTRTDELVVEPTTGVYWAIGAQWRLDGQDLNPGPTQIDVFRQQGGTLVSIVDQATRDFNREQGLITYRTTFGGEIVVDTNSGSVRFSGGIVPRGERLFVRYAPTFLRVGAVPGANYRNVSMAYDDRFLGVFADPANPQRNLLGELSYWSTANGLRPQVSDLVRADRTVIAYTRTSSEGTSATRPFWRTLRQGVRLPTAVALRPDGSPVNLQVTFPGTVAATEQFYQIDPTNGRVYFMAGVEDQTVTIRYRGVDASGAPFGSDTVVTVPVGLIGEVSEEAIPIEQVGNENALSIALDPLSARFNSATNRRPGMFWFFWTSTRSGGPDVFFQTVAPRFAPRPPTP